MSMMMSTTIAPASSSAAPINKPSTVRSGADLTAASTPNAPVGLYPATPAPTLATPPADAFTPTALDANGNPIVSTENPTTPPTDGTVSPAKTGFDPIALAIGVGLSGVAALLLGWLAKGANKMLPEMGKVFFATGLGAGAAFVAPFGSNLVRDLLKKKPATPTPADATNPAGTPQPVGTNPQALPTLASPPITNVVSGAVPPPAIDPMTGLPVVNGGASPQLRA